MIKKAEKTIDMAGELKSLVNQMIQETSSLDLKRLLKQVEADLMDVKHKLSQALEISKKEA